MGFPDFWVDLTMMCVSYVSFSVLLNGQPQQKFYPNRGLRQGDPLSPYLFIICAEVFSTLINRVASSSAIHRLKVAHHVPSISHLFFADDSMVFTRAT